MEKLNKIDIAPQIKNFEYSKVGALSKYKKRENLSDADKKQIENTARQFESLFVYLVFKGMRKAMLSGFAENEDTSFGSDIMNDLTLMEVTNYFSKNGRGVGLASKIYEALTGEKLKNIENTLGFVSYKPATKKSEESKAIDGTIINIRKKYKSDLLGKISKYESIVQDTARKYNLSPQLLKSIIAVESAGNHRAISPAGAKGLMQLIDSTARYVGVRNVFDPAENIEGGAKYLREMLNTFDGNLELALAAYNAGPGNVFKYNGIPPFKETRNYIALVKRYLNLFNNIDGEL